MIGVENPVRRRRPGKVDVLNPRVQWKRRQSSKKGGDEVGNLMRVGS
jgi:hypothetical protein